jgi:hypothetical protein
LDQGFSGDSFACFAGSIWLAGMSMNLGLDEEDAPHREQDYKI